MSNDGNCHGIQLHTLTKPILISRTKSHERNKLNPWRLKTPIQLIHSPARLNQMANGTNNANDAGMFANCKYSDGGDNRCFLNTPRRSQIQAEKPKHGSNAGEEKGSLLKCLRQSPRLKPQLPILPREASRSKASQQRITCQAFVRSLRLCQ